MGTFTLLGYTKLATKGQSFVKIARIVTVTIPDRQKTVRTVS